MSMQGCPMRRPPPAHGLAAPGGHFSAPAAAGLGAHGRTAFALLAPGPAARLCAPSSLAAESASAAARFAPWHMSLSRVLPICWGQGDLRSLNADGRRRSATLASGRSRRMRIRAVVAPPPLLDAGAPPAEHVQLDTRAILAEVHTVEYAPNLQATARSTDPAAPEQGSPRRPGQMVLAPAERPPAAWIQLADSGGVQPSATSFKLPPGGVPVLDAANVLSRQNLEDVTRRIEELEQRGGWKVRILTRFAPGTFDAEEIRNYWKPDERTLIVIVDVTSPNIFNFNTGDYVRVKLPRQFFIELQSRFGNQFYVAQEGDQRALLQTFETLYGCLSSPDGCIRVPGLSDDLFYLTLATSIAGGFVFGFAARQEPTSQVPYAWQWVLIFSPLWFILFVALGIQPVASRTSDVVPLLKDTLGFLCSAAAVYLTPILGPTPASNWFKKDTEE